MIGSGCFSSNVKPAVRHSAALNQIRQKNENRFDAHGSLKVLKINWFYFNPLMTKTKTSISDKDGFSFSNTALSHSNTAPTNKVRAV